MVKKCLLIAFLSVIGISMTSCASLNTSKVITTDPSKEVTVIVGGNQIIVPVPEQGFREVGDKIRGRQHTSPKNRMLCLFLKDEVIRDYGKPGKKTFPTADIEVAHRHENLYLSPETFAGLTAELEAGGLQKEVSREHNEIKYWWFGLFGVKFHKPEMLGTVIMIPDAYGEGITFDVEIGKEKIKLISACVFLRVKNRLLWLHVYAEYKNDQSIEWVKSITWDWSNRILNANY